MKTLRERLERLSTMSESGCRIWTGKTDRHGYGWIWLRGKNVMTHRAAWEDENGPIPEGRCVLHRCDIRNCIDIAHLFLGSNADNHLDMMKKGRGKRGSGSLPAGVERTRNGSRFVAKLRFFRPKLDVYLGTFDTPEEAFAVADAAYRKHYGI